MAPNLIIPHPQGGERALSPVHYLLALGIEMTQSRLRNGPRMRVLPQAQDSMRQQQTNMLDVP
jgi:hypothetical protein